MLVGNFTTVLYQTGVLNSINNAPYSSVITLFQKYEPT